jgi:phage terminase large subunit-like protein
MATPLEARLAVGRRLAADRGIDPGLVRMAGDVRALERGCTFDAKAAARVQQFLEAFVVLGTAEWAGTPLRLMPWQADLVTRLYGWKRPDGTRRFRRASVWVAKKNAKSETCAALALYHLLGDGEATPHVALAAVDRVQAAIVFDACARMVKRSPEFAPVLEVIDSRKRIVAAGTDGRIEAVSSDTGQKEGLNLSAAILDEIHVWRDRQFLEALRYAGAARRQPVFISISTAGVQEEGAVGWEEWQLARALVEGVLEDDTILPVIYAADPEDHWQAPATWAKANPALGITINERELADAAHAAASSLVLQSSFCRYRLNLWQQVTTAAVDLGVWDANDAHPIDLASYRGVQAYGGLDLAAVSDLTALVWLLPCASDPEALDVVCRAFVPEAALAGETTTAALLRQWVRAGHVMATPGAVADYAFMVRTVVEDAARWTVTSLGVDRLFQGLSAAVALADEGFTVRPVGQGFATMAPLSSAFDRLVTAKRLHHGAQPALRWCVENLEWKVDAAGNRKPWRASRDKKIDLAVALLMALDGWERRDRAPATARSVYEDRDLLVL